MPLRRWARNFSAKNNMDAGPNAPGEGLNIARTTNGDSLERYVIIIRRRGRQRPRRQSGAAYNEQVQNVVAFHEHYLASLGGVKFAAEPVSRGLGDLASGDDEDVVHEHLSAYLGVEYLVAKHHRNLIKDFGDIGTRGSRRGRRVKLAL